MIKSPVMNVFVMFHSDINSPVLESMELLRLPQNGHLVFKRISFDLEKIANICIPDLKPEHFGLGFLKLQTLCRRELRIKILRYLGILAIPSTLACMQ